MIEKQKATLKVSLIPLAIIILLILGVGTFLLKDEIKLPNFNKEPTITRLAGFPTTVTTTKLLDKQREVITSNEKLNEFLNSIDETGLLKVQESINFDKDIVIAATTGTNDVTGIKIKIRKVYEDKTKKRLLVSVEESVPGDSCTPELGKNVAVDIITLSKTDFSITFDKIKKTIECK
jgi:CRISPR/Cas system CMR subunit Cmr4 (Cas7 group RAMP superfamily)